MIEDVDKFVFDLTAEQRRLDEQTKRMAQEIVDSRKLETLEEAKQFAAGWIGIAAQHCRNEEYWAQRARAAEAAADLYVVRARRVL